MAQRKQFALIDVLKLLSAVMIVAIHAQPFLGHENSVFYYPYSYLKCFAVPFFFVSSSFLFFSKYLSLARIERKNYLKKWLKRIGLFYLIYSLINLVLLGVTGEIKALLSINGVLSFTFLGKGNGYLWFVIALILAVLLECLVYCIPKKQQRTILLSVLFIISLGLMIMLQFYYHYFADFQIVTSYYSVFENVRNVLSGYFYVHLGIICVWCNRLREKSKKGLLLLTPLVFVLSFVEYLFVVRKGIYKEEYSTLMISVFLVFLMLVATNIRFHCKADAFFRKVSGVMYFWQRYVLVGLLTLEAMTGWSILSNHVFLFFFVLSACVLLTIVFEGLKRTPLKALIRYLY